MSAEETVDELVDKAIDEALARAGKDSEDIKKRKPKPFRYLTEEEIKAELTPEEETPASVMKEPTVPNVVEDQLAILGAGDVDTIENVIRKHEASRKFRDK
jgi:hypothetical protein